MKVHADCSLQILEEVMKFSGSISMAAQKVRLPNLFHVGAA